MVYGREMEKLFAIPRDGTRATEPVMAVSAIVGGGQGDGFFPIRAHVLFALAASAGILVFLGMCAVPTSTVDFSYDFGDLVMSTAVMSSFSYLPTHVRL